MTKKSWKTLELIHKTLAGFPQAAGIATGDRIAPVANQGT
jgi:hypothetical protein